MINIGTRAAIRAIRSFALTQRHIATLVLCMLCVSITGCNANSALDAVPQEKYDLQEENDFEKKYDTYVDIDGVSWDLSGASGVQFASSGNLFILTQPRAVLVSAPGSAVAEPIHLTVPEGDLLATGGALASDYAVFQSRSRVAVLDLATRHLWTVTQLEGKSRGYAVTTWDNRSVLTFGRNREGSLASRRVQFWDLASRTNYDTFPAYQCRPFTRTSVALAPSAKASFVATGLGKLIEVELASGREVAVMRPSTDEEPFGIERVAVSEDGKIVAGGSRRRIAVWDRGQERPRWTSIEPMSAKNSPPYQIAFLPRAEALVVIRGQCMQLFAIDDGRMLLEAQIRGTGYASPMSFSPDGSLVAILVKDEVRVYRVEDLLQAIPEVAFLIDLPSGL